MIARVNDCWLQKCWTMRRSTCSKTPWPWCRVLHASSREQRRHSQHLNNGLNHQSHHCEYACWVSIADGWAFFVCCSMARVRDKKIMTGRRARGMLIQTQQTTAQSIIYVALFHHNIQYPYCVLCTNTNSNEIEKLKNANCSLFPSHYDILAGHFLCRIIRSHLAVSCSSIWSVQKKNSLP